MSLWPYAGTDAAGAPVKGKVVADDVETAKSKLTKMGVKWERLGDEVAEAPAEVKEQVNGAIKSFQDSVEIATSPLPKVEKAAKKASARQFVLFGPGPQIKSESLPLLERGGRVIHASMSPDSSGRPHVLMVIEVEEKA